MGARTRARWSAATRAVVAVRQPPTLVLRHAATACLQVPRNVTTATLTTAMDAALAALLSVDMSAILGPRLSAASRSVDQSVAMAYVSASRNAMTATLWAVTGALGRVVSSQASRAPQKSLAASRGVLKDVETA